MKDDIENDPEWCGWLRRNDPEFAVKREAAQVVAQFDEMLSETFTPLLDSEGAIVGIQICKAESHPHANVLVEQASFTRFWRMLGVGFMLLTGIVAVVYFSLHIDLWIERIK